MQLGRTNNTALKASLVGRKTLKSRHLVEFLFFGEVPERLGFYRLGNNFVLIVDISISAISNHRARRTGAGLYALARTEPAFRGFGAAGVRYYVQDLAGPGGKPIGVERRRV